MNIDNLGYADSVLKLFPTYVSNRKHRQLTGFKSVGNNELYGVPQESIARFNIFTNDVVDEIDVNFLLGPLRTQTVKGYV